MIENEHREKQDDIRPLVASASTNRSVWLFGGGLTMAALLLFYALESHRASLASSSLQRSSTEGSAAISSPPGPCYSGAEFR